jgi:ppGpp synthetase/RelA/SpoT-type nucleotidyltranferase
MLHDAAMTQGELELRVKISDARDAAVAAEKRIGNVFDASEDLKKIRYSVASRVKTPYRTFEKVIQQRKAGRLKFDPLDLPDICAFRILTLFQSGIVDALEFLVGLARHERILGTSPFIKDSVEYVRLFSNRPLLGNIGLKPQIDAAIDKLGLRDRYQEIPEQEDQYSSLHVVTKCPVHILNGADSNETIALKVEFQIRTIFEEAWSEMDHRLRYARLRGAREQALRDKHMNVLKGLIDDCVQYAQVIKAHYDEYDKDTAELSAGSRSATTSVPRVLSRFRSIPEELYKNLKAAFDTEKQADEMSTINIFDARQLFKKASELFFEVRVDAGAVEMLASPQQKSDLLHLCDVERAWCLYNIADDFCLKEASRIYYDVRRDYPNDAVSFYRHGLTLLDLQGRDDEIEPLFKSAIDLLDSGADSTVPRGHWVHGAVRRSLGFLYWRRADRRPLNETRQRTEDLRLAISVTKEGLSRSADDEEMARFENNLLYYTMEERKLLEPQEKSAVGQPEFQDMFDRLNNYVSGEQGQGGKLTISSLLLKLDTLCKAAGFLARKDDEKIFAKRLINLSRLKAAQALNKSVAGVDLVTLREGLDAEELDSYQYATEVVVKSEL